MNFLDNTSLQQFIRHFFLHWGIRNLLLELNSDMLAKDKTLCYWFTLFEKYICSRVALKLSCTKAHVLDFNLYWRVQTIRTEKLENLETILASTRRIIDMKFPNLIYFQKNDLCDRCGEDFSYSTLWGYTKSPVELCFLCREILDKTFFTPDPTLNQTNAFIAYPDGYAWIKPQLFKDLCGISRSETAFGVAKNWGIRTQSTMYKAPEESYTQSKQEMYLLKDVRPYWEARQHLLLSK